ncbi:MiaB-like tRNA modifying enzyme [uncultured Paludibacter sp.]|uniref:MiaB-like tRNA modifying enzyme n=1 Tax=uncultured Paludibacter sp. TaxID=497635 RepID=A0A653AB23_9BACT|nr:MiaB-like tRNA modifying enzyme [uncultured Paludibacter sp.]
MIDNNIFHNKKVVYHTLGCKLNFAETSHIGRQLSEEGFSKVRTGEEADICIINTCSVTDTADHKCRQAINRLHRQHPKAKIIVTGCYAQLKPDEISNIEGVNLVLGANEKFDIPQFLKESDAAKIYRADILKIKKFRPSYSHDDRTRYFLKVQDGCDYYCTYCTIPLARGHSRSGTVAETVKMAEEIIQAGGKEIVLTGVNTGDFGRHNKETFLDLIKALDAIDAEVRYRISSIEPNLITDEIIRFVAQSKHFMPHFHIPLQGGTNEILRLMKRRYTTELFAEKLNTIKNILPDAFIGVDVIVGVRGETDELFEKGLEFIKSLDFSQLHVFTYSERADTQMLDIEHIVPTKERKRRSDLLHQLSDEKTKSFYEKQIGKKANVLWEAKKEADIMHGFTGNYVRLRRSFDKNLINKFENVIISKENITLHHTSEL